MNWEFGIYDTSVCLRAIVHAHKNFSVRLGLPDSDFQNICKESVRWLISAFDNDKTNTRHPHDPIAISQYLRTLMCVYRNCGHFLPKAPLIQAIHEAAFFLINAGPGIGTISSISDDLAPFWGDDACTAEAVDALGRYIWDCTHNALPEADREVVERGRKLLYASTVHLAVRQADGKWGSEMDSAAALCGYLRACRAIGVPHEDYIVLRSLRWLCGEQVFDDGSFLHTSYVTVYYSLALWEAYMYWPLIAKHPTSVVYDEALRAAPYRPTTERAMRFDLELVNQRLTNEIQDIKAKHYWVNLGLASALAFFLVILIGIIIMYLTGMIKLDTTNGNAANLVSLIAAVVGLLSLMVTVVVALMRKPNNV